MALTPEQIPVLRTALLADTNPDVVAARDARNDTEVARLYNLPSTFVAWKKDTSKSDIFGALTWKNFTPVDAPDGTVIWSNRCFLCQCKQMNLQTMLISPGNMLDMSDSGIRDGIKDAVQNLPAGASGALLDAGWAAVKVVSIRFATVAEKVFATGTGTNGTPGLLVFSGAVTIDDIGKALNG